MVTCEYPTAEDPNLSPFVKRQADFVQAAGVDVDVFHFRGRKNPLNYARAWLEVRRRLRKTRYDLIHAQFGQSGLVAVPTRLPLVVTFRGDDLLGVVGDRSGRKIAVGNLLTFLCRQVARMADASIVVSSHMQPYAPVPTHVLPSGIDFDLFRPLPQQECRERLGMSHSDRLILFVGDPQQKRKRYELACRSVEVLNRSMAAKLIVAWDVDHHEIPVYMSASDVLLFTSMQEGSPNVVKESLACNLPVVSVAVADVGERLSNVKGCELCGDERPETVAAALERVLLRKQRSSGRDTVKDLDEKHIADKVINIYRSVLGGDRR